MFVSDSEFVFALFIRILVESMLYVWNAFGFGFNGIWNLLENHWHLWMSWILIHFISESLRKRGIDDIGFRPVASLWPGIGGLRHEAGGWLPSIHLTCPHQYALPHPVSPAPNRLICPHQCRLPPPALLATIGLGWLQWPWLAPLALPDSIVLACLHWPWQPPSALAASIGLASPHQPCQPLWIGTCLGSGAWHWAAEFTVSIGCSLAVFIYIYIVFYFFGWTQKSSSCDTLYHPRISTTQSTQCWTHWHPTLEDARSCHKCGWSSSGCFSKSESITFIIHRGHMILAHHNWRTDIIDFTDDSHQMPIGHVVRIAFSQWPHVNSANLFC